MTDFPPQVNEYSCGPSAVQYFLAQQNHHFTVAQLIEALHPTPELGTMTAHIERFLDNKRIAYESLQYPYSTPMKKGYLPLLVNYNYANEGDHYSVITEIDKGHNITLWNPDTAELNYYSLAEFKIKWYSPLKKLKNWSLYLT